MTARESISGFTTHFALKSGIKAFEGEICSDGSVKVLAVDGVKQDWPFFLHKEGLDWHRTRQEAVRRAEAMRKKRIATWRKQIAKLEKVTFG